MRIFLVHLFIGLLAIQRVFADRRFVRAKISLTISENVPDSIETKDQIFEIQNQLDRNVTQVRYHSILSQSNITDHWDGKLKQRYVIDETLRQCRCLRYKITENEISFPQSWHGSPLKSCFKEPRVLVIGEWKTKRILIAYTDFVARFLLDEFSGGSKTTGQYGEDVCLFSQDLQKGLKLEEIKYKSFSGSNVSLDTSYNIMSIGSWVKISKTGYVSSYSDLREDGSNFEDLSLCRQGTNEMAKLKVWFSTEAHNLANVIYPPMTHRQKFIDDFTPISLLDRRRINSLQVHYDSDENVLFAEFQLLEAAGHVEAERSSEELPERGFDREHNIRQLLNLSSLEMPAKNQEECNEFCKKHQCDTSAYCYSTRECHLYLFPINLPGSFKSKTFHCTVTQMSNAGSKLGGPSLKHLELLVSRAVIAGGQPEIQLDKNVTIYPVRYAMEYQQSSGPDIDAPTGIHYQIVKEKHRHLGSMEDFQYKAVSDDHDCARLCNQDPICQTISYCESSSRCFLSKLGSWDLSANSSLMTSDEACSIQSKPLLSQFHQLPSNGNISIYDTLPRAREELESCAINCLTNSSIHCTRFEICQSLEPEPKYTCNLNFPEATHNEIRKPEICQRYRKDILLLYDGSGGQMLVSQVKHHLASIENIEDCAQSCSDSPDCGAFEFCNVRGPGYYQFETWCSIGNVKTLAPSIDIVQTSNKYCSVFRALNSKLRVNATIDDDKDDQQQPVVGPETGKSSSSETKSGSTIFIVHSLIALITMAAAFFVTMKYGRRKKGAGQVSPSGVEGDESADRKHSDSTELQTITIDENPSRASIVSKVEMIDEKDTSEETSKAENQT